MLELSREKCLYETNDLSLLAMLISNAFYYHKPIFNQLFELGADFDVESTSSIDH